MKSGSRWTVPSAVATLLVFLLTLGSAGGRAQSAQSTGPSSSNSLLAEQYFKNIQILKGIPVDQFMGTMGFIAAATGMNCSQCHVEESGSDWARYADDTPLKQTARKMMVMVNLINQSNFGGRREVTCYSCHRGGTRPKVIPDLTEQYAVPAPVDPDEIVEQIPGAPSVDQVLDKYVQALGGTQRLASITSFVIKGTFQSYDDPQKHPVDVYAKAPGQRTVIMHTPSGDSTTTFDGNAAWTAAPLTDLPKPQLVLTGQYLDGARFDAALSFPGRIKQALSNWRVGPLTTIDDNEVRIVQGTGPGGATIKLYFDPQSGLLVRQQRTANTPIGAIPTRIDYADYRDVAGIKMPFHWTVTWTDGRNIFDVNQVQPNVPIDAARFVEPPPSTPPSLK